MPLGYWVLEQVCNESLENGLNRKVSVNISPVQLRHRSFIEKVREILMRTAYPVSLLEFEVTETAFVINKQLAFSVLHHLQKMGISIALDDFGTGYSSLSMLRDFSFRRHQTRPQLYDRCGEQPSGTLIRASHYFAGQFDQYAAYRRGGGNGWTTADPRRGGM